MAPRKSEELQWPFCGDEYPPLKGSPGFGGVYQAAASATKIHLNEETGWVWRSPLSRAS